MNINPSLTRDLAPVVEDVGASKLPWNPTHPAMTPLTDAAKKRGLAVISQLKQTLFAEPEQPLKRDSARFADKWCAPYGADHEQTEIINAIADERAEPQVTADIAALSSLDNQKLGLYQHA